MVVNHKGAGAALDSRSIVATTSAEPVSSVRDKHVEFSRALLVVEAMKMEHAMTSPVAGTVKLLVAPGEQVAVGQSLVLITAPDTDDDIKGENA